MNLRLTFLLYESQADLFTFYLLLIYFYSVETGARPGLRRNLQRQYPLKAAVCYFFTVAGCIR